MKKIKKTGKRDTITVGSTVELWSKSEKPNDYRQPLLKRDFNNNTFYLKAQLVSITDSTLVLIKGQKPAFMLPLPPPYSLIPLLAMKLMAVAKESNSNRKSMSMMFDTIRINEIVKFRVENMVTEGAVKGLTMMPLMSFLPSYFTTWPTTLYAMPGMMIGSELLVHNTFFSTRRVNTEESNHRIFAEKAPITKPLLPKMEASKYQEKWEYEKIDQWNKVKVKLYDQLLVNAMNDYRGTQIIGISLGYMMYPSYAIGPDDKRTKVNIPDKNYMFGFSMENFISNKLRVGMEMQNLQVVPINRKFLITNVGWDGLYFFKYREYKNRHRKRYIQ